MFKVGDRVYCLDTLYYKSVNSAWSNCSGFGTITQVNTNNFIIEYDNYPYVDDMRHFQHNIILAEVFESPLFKALNEQTET